MTQRALSPKRERFACMVVEGKSQTEALRQVYPRSQTWAPAAQHAQAHVIMSNPAVQARVRELQARAADAACLTATDALREVKRIALSDIRRITAPDGRVLRPHELDADTAAAVASFKIDENGRIEYRFWDKNVALEKAMKHLGLYEVDNRQQAQALVGVVRLVPLAPREAG